MAANLPNTTSQALSVSRMAGATAASPTPLPFLGLPPEIRNKIYDFAFPEDGPGVFCRCRHPTTPAREDDALGLVFTCRQVYNETLDYAYKKITLCGDTRHTEEDDLLALAYKRPKALHTIRTLNLTIDYHFDDMSKYCDAFYGTTTYKWSWMLVWLNWERLSLESLNVHFVCDKPSDPEVDYENPHTFDFNALYDALCAMESCRVFKFTGNCDFDVWALHRFWVNEMENPLPEINQAGTEMILRNSNWQNKWNKVQAAQYLLREGNFQETDYAKDCLTSNCDWYKKKENDTGAMVHNGWRHGYWNHLLYGNEPALARSKKERCRWDNRPKPRRWGWGWT